MVNQWSPSWRLLQQPKACLAQMALTVPVGSAFTAVTTVAAVKCCCGQLRCPQLQVHSLLGRQKSEVAGHSNMWRLYS